MPIAIPSIGPHSTLGETLAGLIGTLAVSGGELEDATNISSLLCVGCTLLFSELLLGAVLVHCAQLVVLHCTE